MTKNYLSQSTKSKKFSGLFLGFLILIVCPLWSQTVIIPRDGFPYCEPFTNSTTRANTVFDGTPNQAFLTAAAGLDAEGDGFLQLTDNSTDQRGYVFIDLPFSAAYGIKVSFEYFAFGGINPPAYADGISFFMFDGSIGPSTFQIGGLGGSLGYAPWRRNANLTPIPDQPGLKGGYIGIGFDALRNWGNEYEGRFGGFKNPAAQGFGPVPDERQYYNSIAIRGPESSNYQFIDGKRTFSRSFLNEEQPAVYTDPISSSYYLFDNLAPLDYLDRRFRIGSVNKAEVCSQDGYRKVFIDLAPDGAGRYLVTVDMLVNNGGTLRLENIFTNVPYNFPAPSNLKIGFAASTGTPNTNFHQIRNVTAQVSDYANIPIPEIEELDAEICVNQTNLFEFDVKLTSANSFIRCVQLFENDPGAPDNASPVGGDPSLTNCGMSDVCIDKCDPNKQSVDVTGGEFLLDLSPNPADPSGESQIAKIKFVPDPGFVGTAVAYYQVLDNYGLLSFPKKITAVVNPYPIEVQEASIDNPSCNGQSDGIINDLIIGDLVSGFDYEWSYNGNPIGKTGASVSPLAGGQATFELVGINKGTYTLTVWNPSETGRCVFEVDVVVDQEDGTPVELDDENKIICEGNSVEFSPSILPEYGSDSGAEFAWYLTADKSGGPIASGSTATIGGASVQFTITSGRDISISGLESNGNSPKDYTFYVEAKPKSNPTGNFCPYLGDVLAVAKVTVYPPIDFSAVKNSDDWCLSSGGQIQASVTNPTSTITFTLVDDGGNVISTNSTGTFPGLDRGDYEVFAESSSPVCSSVSIPIEIEGPAESLALEPIASSPEYCDLENGSLEFSLSGGNVPYSSITVGGLTLPFTQTGNNYVVTGLAGGTYPIEVLDARNCPISISMEVPYEAPSLFETTDDEICEGQSATVQAIIVNQSTSTPSFAWFASDGSGGYLPITNGGTINGATFSINSATRELTVSGLAPSNTPYTYYLKVTGSKVCDQDYIPAEILVNFGPEMSPPIVTMVKCHDAADGSIQAAIPSGNLSDYQFSLVGDNGFNAPFDANLGLFENLAAGTYELFIKSSEGCESSIADLEITEPSQLILSELSKVEPTCGEDNGVWTFEVSGGTPDGSSNYTMTLDGVAFSGLGADLVENSSGNFTVSNLDPGVHVVKAVDSNNCEVELTVDFIAQPIPDFGTQNVAICEGEDAVLIPQIIDLAGSTPVFSWSYEDTANPGTYIQIDSGDKIGDLTFTISNGELTINGLVYQAAAYKFYLNISGDLVCPEEPIPAEVQVLKIPVAVFETEPVSCYNGNDGQINLISSDPASNMTYTLIETGASNATGNFTGLKAGDYTIEIQEAGSPCNATATVTVEQPDELLLINDESQNPTCGENNGSISFEISGGTPAYTILINGKPTSDFTSSLAGNVVEVKNLAPGNYSVQVTDEMSCVITRTDLFVLVNDAGIDVSVDPMEDEVCEGLDASLVPEFQSPPPVIPDFNWYKDAGLTQPITSSATPDSEGIVYQVSPSTGELKISGLAAGSFTYFLEISGPGICTSVDEAQVLVHPPIVSTLTVTNELCFGVADGTISVTSSGGNGLFEYSLNGGAFGSNSSFSALSPGSYTVVIRNELGCTETHTAEVLGPPSAIQTNTPDLIRSSCDLDNGSIENLVISGGWGDYIVEWRKDSATGVIIPGDATGAADLAPGTYFLLVTDKEGCEATFNFSIEESSDPVYAVVPPIDSCTGSPVSIRPIHIAPDPSLPPAAATEVEWYTGPGRTGLIQNGPDTSTPAIVYAIDDSDWLNPELNITGLPAGVYDYYFYVVCTGQEIKIDVTVYDTPTVVLETQPIACFGDTNGKVTVVSGSNPSYTYSLNGGNPTSQASMEALNLGAGVYDLEVATPAGCSQTLTFTIEGPSAALQSSQLTKIDPGCGSPNGKLELNITGGWVPYTLEVFKNGLSLGTQSTSDSDVSLDGYTPGEYYITVTDNGGCTLTTNPVTLVDGPTQVLVDDVEICEGTVATLIPALDPPAPGAVFQWYLNSSLTQPITSSPSPAADGNIYQVNPSTGVLSVSNLSTKATPYSYFVTASGSAVCPGFVGQADVMVSDSPTATANIKNEVCFGEGGEIEVIATGGSGNYTYSLNGGAFGTPNVFQVATGTHQVEVLSSAGCSFILDNIVVAGPAGKLAVDGIEQDSPSCDLDNGEIRFEIGGGYEPYVVTMKKNGADFGSQTLASAGQIKFSNLGIGAYSFLVSDAQGCQIPLPSTITLVEQPTVIQANDDTICEGETAELIPSVPQNIVNPQFSWYFDSGGLNPISNGTVNGVTYSTDSGGKLTIAGLSADQSPVTYYVVAVGAGICGVEPKPVKVTVSQIPTLRVSNPSVVCDPAGTVDLTDYIEGFNPDIYDYDVLSPSGAAMQLGEMESVAVSGDYRVSSSKKGTNCWNAAQRIRVLISEELLVANFEFDVDLGGGNIVTGGDIQIEENVLFKDLSVGNAILWNWDFGDGSTSSEKNPIHQYTAKGAYTVTLQVIDDIGCVSNYQITVNVFDDYLVMIPNAFTPDGLKNQYFKPQFRGIATMEFYIFNTWGELIYQANSLEDLGWDGTLNGTPVPNGNYVYRGNFVSRSGEKIDKSGVFVLIR